MADRDVTAETKQADNPDDESLPLAQCVCGKTYKRWQMILSVYRDAEPMPCCGRRLYFSNAVQIFERVD